MTRTSDISRITCLGLSAVMALGLWVALAASLGVLGALIVALVVSWLAGGLMMQADSSGMADAGPVIAGATQVAEALFAPRAEPAPQGPAVRLLSAPPSLGAPQGLDAPRNGGADDLKAIKGIGPKLAKTLNDLGIYHYDQIAGWNAAELAWIDENLKGFRGRASRDRWIAQASGLLQARLQARLQDRAETV